MTFWILWALYMLLILGLSIGAIILLVLVARAFWKCINTKTESNAEAVEKKRLADVLKENRIRCKMTQEFVAESLGVSRQAVSKWENGTSDPSTSNLLALSKLYEISIDDVLKTQQEKNNR